MGFPMASHFLLLRLLAITCSVCLAFDESPLQDFCVADLNSTVRVNGVVCKDPKAVQATDFSFSGLQLSGNTSNPYGWAATPVTVFQLPGLNTLGISLVRLDFLPGGVNPPHTHPRATEIVTVLQGTLEVGFVTTYPENRLITKSLQTGDVFVFPLGLVHFMQNAGAGNAVAIGALNSQNPGLIPVPRNVFGSIPDISPDLLAKAFQVNKTVIAELQQKF